MKIARRAPLVTLAVLVLALSIAACGGSSNSSKSASSRNVAATTATKGSGRAGFTAFTNCLKQHGVKLPKSAARGFRGRFPGAGTRTTGTPPTGTNGHGGYPGGGYPGGRYPGGGYPGGGYPGRGAPGGGGFFGGRGGSNGARGFFGGNSKSAKAFQACRSKLPTGGFGGRRFGNRPGGAGGPGFSQTALKSYVACVRKNGYPQMPEPKTGTRAVFPSSLQSNAKFRAASAKCESILRKAFQPSGQTTTPASSSSGSTSST